MSINNRISKSSTALSNSYSMTNGNTTDPDSSLSSEQSEYTFSISSAQETTTNGSDSANTTLLHDDQPTVLHGGRRRSKSKKRFVYDNEIKSTTSIEKLGHESGTTSRRAQCNCHTYVNLSEIEERHRRKHVFHRDQATSSSSSVCSERANSWSRSPVRSAHNETSLNHHLKSINDQSARQRRTRVRRLNCDKPNDISITATSQCSCGKVKTKSNSTNSVFTLHQIKPDKYDSDNVHKHRSDCLVVDEHESDEAIDLESNEPSKIKSNDESEATDKSQVPDSANGSTNMPASNADRVSILTQRLNRLNAEISKLAVESNEKLKTTIATTTTTTTTNNNNNTTTKSHRASMMLDQLNSKFLRKLKVSLENHLELNKEFLNDVDLNEVAESSSTDFYRKLQLHTKPLMDWISSQETETMKTWNSSKHGANKPPNFDSQLKTKHQGNDQRMKEEKDRFDLKALHNDLQIDEPIESKAKQVFLLDDSASTTSEFPMNSTFASQSSSSSCSSQSTYYKPEHINTDLLVLKSRFAHSNENKLVDSTEESNKCLLKRLDSLESKLNDSLYKLEHLTTNSKTSKKNYSNDFKVVKRSQYEALKLQALTYRNDYNSEQKEKLKLKIAYEKKSKELQDLKNRLFSSKSLSSNPKADHNDLN